MKVLMQCESEHTAGIPATLKPVLESLPDCLFSECLLTQPPAARARQCCPQTMSQRGRKSRSGTYRSVCVSTSSLPVHGLTRRPQDTVGPDSATKAVLLVYAILGWNHQVFTGADLLASQLADTVVLVPDFFKGKALPTSAFALPPEERKKVVSEFVEGPAHPNTNVAAARRVVADARDSGLPNIKKWAALGLCWGGKLTAILSGKDSPFVVAGTGHPG